MDLAGNLYNMKVHLLISLLPPDKLSWKTIFFLPTMQLIHFHNTPSYPTPEMPFGGNHSTEAVGRVGSGSSTGSHRGVPLNIHGMAMSKYCYECGTKFPVPQAKYCCECGTKRI